MRIEDDKTVPCRICTKPTPMLGTKLCDPCWELNSRLYRAALLMRSEDTGVRERVAAMLRRALEGKNPE